MNSILTAKSLSQTNQLAGHDWFYEFREVDNFSDEGTINKVTARLSEKYSKITKDWSKVSNSEWICRMYLSAKMILIATLQIEALEHAKTQNLRIVVPYLEYYTFLALLRAIVYTLPEVEWDDGKLATISHKKAINLSYDYVSSLNRDGAHYLKCLTLDLKANRELISYRSPTSGDGDAIRHGNILVPATLLAEIAQMNSEVLERSILKNAENEDFVFQERYVSQLSSVTIEDRPFFDKEDAYRLGYLARKYPRPANIMHLMTEGHVEDFFGAWSAEQESEASFDPDKNWRIIFDVP